MLTEDNLKFSGNNHLLNRKIGRQFFCFLRMKNTSRKCQ